MNKTQAVEVAEQLERIKRLYFYWTGFAVGFFFALCLVAIVQS